MLNRRFGRLTVVAEAGNSTGKWGRPQYLCRCDCGGEKVTTGKLLRSGDTRSCGCLIGRHPIPLHVRFSSFFTTSDGCWAWKGCVNSEGYGQVMFRGKNIRAHRVSWVIHHRKPIPRGMVVMHTCDNPGCVNPAHLVLGTHKDNALDRKQKGRNGWLIPFGNNRLPISGGANAPGRVLKKD